MRIMVSGASGFIGSHFVRHVLGHTSHQVRALIRNTDQRNLKRLDCDEVKNAGGRYQPIFGDLLSDISGICEGIDWVVHFAAKTYVDHCYSADTEVLTTRGWIVWPEVVATDLFATLNPATREFQWQAASRLYCDRYDGDLINVESRSLDLLVTPGHKFFGHITKQGPTDPGPAGFVSARDIAAMKRGQRGLPFRIPVRCSWVGSLPPEGDTVRINVAEDFGHKYHRETVDVPLMSWVKFLGIYLAEGRASGSKKFALAGSQAGPAAKSAYTVGLCQSMESPHLNDIRELLEELPWAWRYYNTQFVASNKALYSHLRPLGNSYTKRVPAWVKNLPVEYLREFVKWAVKGDGSVMPRTDDSSVDRYYTTSKVLADDMQEIFQKLGLAASIRLKKVKGKRFNRYKNVKKRQPMYQVLGRSLPQISVRSASSVPYCGNVYCAEVPNHILLVRRNGYATWCGNSIKDAAPFVEANVVGTFRLLEEARRHLATVRRFVSVGTDEVYGAILKGAYDENSRLNPTNPYAASKAGADGFAISYAHTYGLHTIITRTENNYGSHQHPQKVFPVFTKMAMRDQPLPVYGDGLHVRQWLHVSDHVIGILHLLNADTKPGEVFHIAGSQELTNLELAHRILDALGKPRTLIKHIDDHDIRPGHDRRYALDCTKAHNLGWKAKVGLDIGIPLTVGWYRDHPEYTEV